MKPADVKQFDRTEHNNRFSPILWAHVEQHRLAREPLTKRKIKESLKEALKKWTDTPVSMVSKGALDLAARKNRNRKNLFSLMWPHRKKCGVDSSGKSLLLWEHTTPLEEACSSILECDTAGKVDEFMMNYSGVCWITRDEDKRLTDEGYRFKRSKKGWRECYEHCGIEIEQRSVSD